MILDSQRHVVIADFALVWKARFDFLCALGRGPKATRVLECSGYLSAEQNPHPTWLTHSGDDMSGHTEQANSNSLCTCFVCHVARMANILSSKPMGS